MCDTAVGINVRIIGFVAGVDIKDSSTISNCNELIEERNLVPISVVLTRIRPERIYRTRWFEPELKGEDKVVDFCSIGGVL